MNIHEMVPIEKIEKHRSMERLNDRLQSAAEEKFITLPGEKLILVQRKYFLTLVLPAITIVLSGFFSLAFSFTLFLLLSNYPTLFLSSLATTLILMMAGLSKLGIDWYFNFYIVTSRKILEIKYAPLFSREINKVLLDQVRCTEIDARVDGFINEFLDIGDITMTFDRPTHQEEFVIKDVKDPKEVERYLETTLVPSITGGVYESAPASVPKYDQRWRKDDANKWEYVEDFKRGIEYVIN